MLPTTQPVYALAATLLALSLVTAAAAQTNVRVATYNTSLTGSNNLRLGDLLRVIESNGTYDNANQAAEVLQINRPDIVLLNEFDYEPSGADAQYFIDNYLNVSQNGQAPIDYQYVYLAESNTGIHSGFDLDNNGQVVSTPGSEDYGNDAFGFGTFPGQFGQLILSNYEITGARTFQEFLWKDMPGARLPDDPSTAAPQDWYSPAELDAFRLSSKSHWDLTVDVNGQELHVLASHPTPPVFDQVNIPGYPDTFAGTVVDYNGKRNADEVRFWDDYIEGVAGPTATDDNYIYDDEGNFGGIEEGASFVILGDLNADVDEGDGIQAAIQALLNDPLLQDPLPTSDGYLFYPSDAYDEFDTATFELRADYVLPSSDLIVTDSGVFWPAPGQPGSDALSRTDHRLVYVDITIPEPATAALLASTLSIALIRRPDRHAFSRHSH